MYKRDLSDLNPIERRAYGDAYFDFINKQLRLIHDFAELLGVSPDSWAPAICRAFGTVTMRQRLGLSASDGYSLHLNIDVEMRARTVREIEDGARGVAQFAERLQGQDGGSVADLTTLRDAAAMLAAYCNELMLAKEFQARLDAEKEKGAK